MFAVVFVG